MLNAVLLDSETLKPEALDMSALETLPIALKMYPSTSPDERIARIKDAHIVLSNKVVLDETVLSQAPHCRYIGVLATGTNNVDHDYCDNNGIRVANVEGYGTKAVVQHTMMLLLNLVTSFRNYNREVEAGDWSKARHFCLTEHPVMELSGKHLVIVGYGQLGKGFAEIATAFGMRVTVAARPGKTGDLRPSLESLLPEADVLSLHCALSKDTEKLINEDRLKLMKPSAFLLNTARGGLIDEPALLHALKNGVIAGAGVDVLSEEPPPSSNPLTQANIGNLLITPHTAWFAVEARQRLVNIAAQRLHSFLTEKG